MVGVVGLDILMDQVIDLVEVEGVAGLRESFLLDTQGRIMVRSSEKGELTNFSLHGNSAKERLPIGVPALERKAAGKEVSGIVRAGRDLYVFARLHALPWLLVTRVDGVKHGLSRPTDSEDPSDQP